MRSASWVLLGVVIACQPKKQAETVPSNTPVWGTPTYPTQPVNTAPPTTPETPIHVRRHECSQGIEAACQIVDLVETQDALPIAQMYINGVVDDEALRFHYTQLLHRSRSEAEVDRVVDYVKARNSLALKFTADCYALAQYGSPKGVGELCQALAENIRWGNPPMYNTAEVAKLSQSLGFTEQEFTELASWEQYRQQQQPASSYE